MKKTIEELSKSIDGRATKDLMKDSTLLEDIKDTIDFTTITKEEASKLGFRIWSSKPNEPQDVWLIPAFMYSIIPDGLEITSVS